MMQSVKRQNDERIFRLPTLESQLAAWVSAVRHDEASRNLTLKRRGFNVYVRRSYRVLQGANVTTLDIASITIPEKARGRGWFRYFRQIAEALNPWNATYYESVLNPRLLAYFNEQGLTPHAENSYYVMHRLPEDSR